MGNKENAVRNDNDKDKSLETKNNTLKAFLFSLLIMIGGAVLWGVIYAIGFFSAWIAFIPAFGAVLVYKKYKPDGKVGMFFYILLLSILFNYFAMLISATISAMHVAEFGGYSFGEVISLAFKVSFTDGISDTMVCIGFTALGVGLGSGGYKFRRWKKTNRSSTSIINPNMVVPSQNGTVGPIEEETVEIGAPAEEDKAEKLLDELVGYVEMYENKLVEKDEFIKLVQKFDSEKVDALSEEEKTDIIIACAKAEENGTRETARKILVKLLAK